MNGSQPASRASYPHAMQRNSLPRSHALHSRYRPRNKKGLVAPGIAAFLLLLLVGCGSEPSGSSGTSGNALPTVTTQETTKQNLEWKKCGDIECASITVPFDYAAPDKGSFILPLTRQRALDDDLRVGALFVNPGGPGAPGTSLVQNSAYYFSKNLLDHFDIIGWDPRGTGASEPTLDCVDNNDTYFASEHSMANTQQFVDACVAKSSEILPYVSTAASARDIDTIRQALGETRINYFGFSYGGLLGVHWANMFPSTVRSAVFDGAPDPLANNVERRLAQAKGFESQLAQFLDTCMKRKTCPFPKSSEPAKAFDELVDRVSTTPIDSAVGRTPVTKTVLLTAVASTMYDDAAWPELDAALSLLLRDDGTGTLALFDTYYYQDSGFEDFRNVSEAAIAISCLDDPNRSTDAVDTALPNFIAAAPRFGDLFGRDYSCALWPAPPVTPLTLNADTPPIVVLGSTGDPATPLTASKAMAAALTDGRFIEVTANRHTSYLKNDCATKLVDAYLINLDIPATLSRC